MKVDQDARKAWIEWAQKRGSYSAPAKDLPPAAERMKRVDADNLKWIKSVVAKRGWPGTSLVGSDGSHDAWLLVQHADTDRTFQKRCVKLMEDAAAKDEASKTDLAYLVDRVLVGEGKKQQYGTQTKIVDGEVKVDPIEDEANVDKRRAEAGMPPLAEYLKLVREMYLGKNERPKGTP